jgi:predicted nucleic acid-binding protein
MSELLHDVPNGSDILIDANVFIYGLTAKSAQCKALLERCSREEVTGATLFEVLHETTHKFMIAEAQAKGLFSGQSEKGARYLSKHPEHVKVLTDYWTNTVRLLALNIILLPIEEDIAKAGQSERVNAGLLTIDSIIVATMRGYGISKIATNDRQFEAVAGITVFSPTDVVV